MKNNLYFENVMNIGNLYLEYVFLEFYKEPIFFTCIDESENMYICLCSEIRGEQRWIISECSIDSLQQLVDGTMDMGSVFKVYDNIILVKRNWEGKEESSVILSQNIDPLDLPKNGTLLKCNQSKAMNYLADKNRELLSKNINSIVDKMPMEKPKNMYKEIFDTADILDTCQMNIPDRVKQEFLACKDKENRYFTDKRMLYQNNKGKNEMESVNDKYLFAA